MGKIPAITKSIRKQKAFVSVKVLWPVCNSNKVVPIDLTGQPYEDASGQFAGYHGFGVIRSADAKKASEQVKPLAVLNKLRAELHQPEPATTPEAVSTKDSADVILSSPETQEDADSTEAAAVSHSEQTAASSPPSFTTEDRTEDTFTEPGFLRIEPEVPELILNYKEDEAQAEASIAEASEILEEKENPSNPLCSNSQPSVPQQEREAQETSECIATDEQECSTSPQTNIDTPHSEIADALQIPPKITATDDSQSTEPLALAEVTSDLTPEPQTSFVRAVSPSNDADDFQRAIADLPDAPSKPKRDGPRSLAELTNSIVQLVDKGASTREHTSLSRPEQDAFERIARALGAETQATLKPANDAPSKTTVPESHPTSSPQKAAEKAVADVRHTPSAHILPLPADTPSTSPQEAASQPSSPEARNGDNITHVVLPRVPKDIEQAAAVARTKNGRIPDKPIVAPIDPRLLDRLPIGVAIVRERDVVYANDTLLELLGYERFEALGQAGGLEAIFAEPEECPAPTSQTVDREVHVRLATGGVLAVDARMHAVPWNNAQALMISVMEKIPALADLQKASGAISRDTVPFDLDRELQHAKSHIAELESVLNTATDGILVLDQHGVIRSANQSAEALFGAQSDDLIGASLTDYLAEESHANALDYLDGLTANGVSSVLNDGREVICKTLNGEQLPVFLSMGRVKASDDQKFCALLRDITRFKRAEEELVSARLQAEEANAHKSEYLTKVTHEIRTPLTAVIGFSEVMQEERFGELGNVRYKEYARDINRSCTHMLHLINDLLDLAKIEAGRMDIAFEAVSATEIINECIALLQPQANEQRIIIRASAPTSIPQIVADPTTLRQIILNLLSNAIKFNRPGGQVVVSLVMENNGEVRLRIRDTGRGMSKDQLNAAMEPFRRLDATATTEGSGLGLPLTKALVEANRANLSILSEEDQGTLAEVTFPQQRVLAE